MNISSTLDMPPYHYLRQVLDHCPKAGLTYIDIWARMDKDNRIKIDKEAIRNNFLVSLSKFRHDLLLLVKEGLISIEETPKTIKIEVVGWDDEEDFD